MREDSFISSRDLHLFNPWLITPIFCKMLTVGFLPLSPEVLQDAYRGMFSLHTMENTHPDE